MGNPVAEFSISYSKWPPPLLLKNFSTEKSAELCVIGLICQHLEGIEKKKLSKTLF